MASDGTALRKRQQIAKANRTMFMWVAGVSVVVGIAAVASLFLVQKALFNEKVLAEKSKTVSTLEKNNEVVEELQNQIRLLNTSEALKENMVTGENQPVQVVLDALPSSANSSAFGASLQQRFLKAEGVELDTLNVEPIRDAEVASTTSRSRSTGTRSTNDSEYQVRFSFDVSARADNAQALKDLLNELGRSIRPITLTNVVIEVRNERLSLKADGVTYYQPAQTIELRDKVIRP